MVASAGPDTRRMHDRLASSIFGGSDDVTARPTAVAYGLGSPRAPYVEPATTIGRSSLSMSNFSRRRDETLQGLDQERPHATLPFGLNGSADNGLGRFNFATSLVQMRAAAANEQERKEVTGTAANGLMSLGSNVRRDTPAPASLDFWVQGSFSYFSSDRLAERQSGHSGLFHAGVDYVALPGLLVGAMMQMDSMEQTSSTNIRNTSGQGWMAGPYVAARLTQHLFFDARALVGRSSNHTDPVGAYTDVFETERGLISAKLSGHWVHGAWSFRPSAEVVYFTDRQKAYTNSIGIRIDSQSVALGRLTFGPEFAYRIDLDHGRKLEPFVSLRGVWDFARAAETIVAREQISGEDWRGRVEAGISLRSQPGLTVRASASYDGIGDSHFHAWRGQALVVLPF